MLVLNFARPLHLYMMFFFLPLPFNFLPLQNCFRKNYWKNNICLHRSLKLAHFFRSKLTAMCPLWTISSLALKIYIGSLAEMCKLWWVSVIISLDFSVRKLSSIVFLEQWSKADDYKEEHEQIFQLCKWLNWTKWKENWFLFFDSVPNKSLSTVKTAGGLILVSADRNTWVCSM